MSKIYFIGGSPCSGKSTLASLLAEKHNLHYFKIDEKLDTYYKKGKEDNKPLCTKFLDMTAEEIWMRSPEIQNTDELALYKEIFEYAIEDLEKLDAPNGIITEGALYLPELIKDLGISPKNYVAITPTKTFQWFHYPKRPWVEHVLANCSDKKLAFSNWMERDILFGGYVRLKAKELGYKTFLTDEFTSIDLMYQWIKNIFNL